MFFSSSSFFVVFGTNFDLINLIRSCFQDTPAGGLTNTRLLLISVIVVAGLAIYVATGSQSPKSSPESATASKARAPPVPKFLFRAAVGSEVGLPELDPLAVLKGLMMLYHHLSFPILT
jgi:hypothetical protein